MMNPEFDITELPLTDHPGAISRALDDLETALDAIAITQTQGTDRGTSTA
ncbi:hypothetical protein [Stomatohabitans albus]